MTLAQKPMLLSSQGRSGRSTTPSLTGWFMCNATFREWAMKRPSMKTCFSPATTIGWGL